MISFRRYRGNVRTYMMTTIPLGQNWPRGQKIEKIQERALRFISDDYISPLSVIFNEYNTTFLHIMREKLVACRVFKI